jgi:DNA-binding MarR family transcriptional regulator
MQPGRLGDDSSELIAAFDAVVRANASVVTQVSARAGIHESALRALTLISDTGYSTPTEVAGYLGLTSGAVTNMVDRLSAAGFVERQRNPNDRRGSHLVLSPAGTALVAEVRQRYADVLRTVDTAGAEDLLHALSDIANGLLQQAAAISAPKDPDPA